MLCPIPQTRNRKSDFDDDDLGRVYHIIMSKYGYINPKEFTELPITWVLEAMKQISEENEREKEEIEKAKHKSNVRKR